jgi:hypothetical protein
MITCGAGFLTAKFVAAWSILALIPTVVGTLAGGWFYREGA